MKKSIFSFSLLLFFALNNIAQAPAVLFSQEYLYEDFGKVHPEMIGYSQNSFYTYNLIKGKIHMQEFAKDGLAFKKEFLIDLPGKDGSEKGILKIINSRVNNVIYFITSELNKHDDVYSVYGFTIDYNGLSSEAKLLERMSTKKWKEHWSYGYAVSPNEKYFVLYHDLSKLDNPSQLVEYNVFGLINSPLVKGANIKLPTEYNNYKLLNVLIDDSAGFFVSIANDVPTINKARYILFAYLEKEDVLEEIKYIGGLFPFDVCFAMDKTNTILCTGLSLDKKDLKVIQGYFCIRVSNITRKVISRSAKEIDSKFQMAYLKMEGANGSRAICDLPLRSVNRMADSSMYLSSEVYHTGYESNGNLGRNVYYYGDILTAVISPAGEINTINIIPKCQIAYDSYHKLGCMLISPGKEVGYVYLDDKKNYKRNEHVKEWPMEKASFSDAVSALVNSNGIAVYKVLEDINNSGMEKPDVQTGMCISDDNRGYILVSFGRKGFTFIKLKY